MNRTPFRKEPPTFPFWPLKQVERSTQQNLGDLMPIVRVSQGRRGDTAESSRYPAEATENCAHHKSKFNQS